MAILERMLKQQLVPQDWAEFGSLLSVVKQSDPEFLIPRTQATSQYSYYSYNSYSRNSYNGFTIP